MGRNDMCFCGSGVKQKKCHNIHEHSHGAFAIKTHSRIDERVEDHYRSNQNSVCSKGCDECCSHYFPIPDIEFDLILLELSQWGTNELNAVIQKSIFCWEKFKIEYPQYAENLERNSTNNIEIQDRDIRFMPEKLTLPCVFLDEKSSCKIYSVRPSICRYFGTTYMGEEDHKYSLCSRIPDSSLARKWQVRIDDIEDDISGLSQLIAENHRVIIQRRTYPIVYHMYMAFHKYKTGTQIEKFQQKFMMDRSAYIEMMYQREITWMSR